MASVGFATLDVIPSLRGAQASIEKQAAGPLSAAGKSGGSKYGSAAGVAAGSSFKGKFAAGVKGIAAPLAGIFAATKAVSFFSEGIDSAREYQKAIAATGAIIKSTGGVAGVASSDVERLSSSLEQQTAVDDAVIARAGALVLTFKNVANAGKGQAAIFDRTLAAATDLAGAGYGAVEDQAKALAKALNDPVKGLSILSRSGVTFTAQQQKQIKALAETGDLLTAQEMILKEVESQVQGTAAAQVDGADRASVAWDNLRQQVGQGLLPALTGFATLSSDKVIPALSSTVTGIGSAVSAFKSLPGPVKAAATAFAALRVASALGITGAVSNGIAALSRSMDGLRLRTMFAAEAFRAQRLSADGAAAGNGRLAASFAGIRAGAIGAAAATRSFLVAALPIAAITAGILIYSKFAGAQQKAKDEQEQFRARVDELTDSLNKQSGAITKATKQSVIKSLIDSGILDDAKQLGISLPLVTKAALGNADAYAKVTDQAVFLVSTYGDMTAAEQKRSDASGRLLSALESESSAVGKARTDFALFAEASGKSADSTDDAAAATQRATTNLDRYSTNIDKARSAVKKLIAAEDKRRENALKDRTDRVALEETLRATQERAAQAARRGKTGVDVTTGKGQTNLSSLYDLASQFNNSSAKVKTNQYDRIREQFVKLADDLGYTTKGAEALARELLQVPPKAAVQFQTPGLNKAREDVRAFKRELASLSVSTADNTGSLIEAQKVNPGAPISTTNYYGTVQYTDDEQARRRAQRESRRSTSDGVRRR